MMPDLKSAFGKTPCSVERLIRNAIGNPEKGRARTPLRTVLIAAALMALCGCVALAVSRSILSEPFTDLIMTSRVNELVPDNIQSLDAVCEGGAVTMTLSEGRVDLTGGSFAFSWTLEKHDPSDDLYVLFDGISFDGEWGRVTNYSNADETFLYAVATDCYIRGSLPDNGISGQNNKLGVTVVRLLGECVFYREEQLFGDDTTRARDYANSLWAEGKIPVEAGDNLIICFNSANDDGTASYIDRLLSTGLVEIADQFVISFDLDPATMNRTLLTCTSPTDYVFDDCELHFR